MAKEIKKEKIKISKTKIALTGVPFFILFFFILLVLAIYSLSFIILMVSPFLFWKIIRYFNTIEETKSIISSLIKFWGFFVILLIVFYLFAPVIQPIFNTDFFTGCPNSELIHTPQGTISQALSELCAQRKSLIGVFAMIILLHIPYLWVTKFVGSRYLK